MPTKKSRRTKIPEKSARVGTLRYFVVGSAVLLALAFLHAPMTARASHREKPEAKPYALIIGTVWDPEGHPLYGIKVKIRRSDEKKARWELFSNHTGEFAQRVPVGKADYIVWADVKGYKLASGKHLKPGSEVTVHIENDERSDTGLHLDW
jgi:hypothetical protein